jgi:GT2 family glycosyltransferase
VGTTAVVVAYGVTHLDLDWLPGDAPLVVVHNDDRLGPIDRPNTTELRGHGNVGFGAAVNLALEHITTPRVALVNPDAALGREHWHALDGGDDHEIVAIPLRTRDGSATVVVSRYPGPLQTVLAGFHLGDRLPGLRRRRRTRLGSAGGPIAEYWASGACVSFPTDALRSVGGFDESFFLYFEDVDLCRRLASLTIRVANTEPGIHDVGGAAATDADRRRARAARTESAWRYAHRQPGILWRLAALVLATGKGHASPPPAATDVVILSLGRRTSMGERRRVASWTALFESLGADVRSIDLLDACPSGLRPPPLRTLRGLANATVQPEALSWSLTKVNRRLAELDPRMVLCISGRAFHPDLAAADIALDYVDRLSNSYRDRVAASTTIRGRLAFRTLAFAAGRFERNTRRLDITRIAAGLADADALDATFVPITARAVVSESKPDVDLVFVGNLMYPPNLAALELMATWWPDIRRRRPGTSMLVAGANPPNRVREMAAVHGWTLVADFADAADVYARARVAVAPLPFASGIQIKVLDAAAHGVPQVVSAAATAGLPPGFPAVVAAPEQFADDVVALLDDPARQAELATASLEWVREQCSIEAWAPAVAELFPAIRRCLSAEWQGGTTAWPSPPHQL